MIQKKLIKHIVCVTLLALIASQSNASQSHTSNKKEPAHNKACEVLVMPEDLPDDVTRELKWTRLLNELGQSVENLKGQVVQHVEDIKAHVSDQIAQHKAEILAVIHSHSSNVGSCFSKLHDRFDSIEDILEDLLSSSTQWNGNFDDMGSQMGELNNLINQALQQ